MKKANIRLFVLLFSFFLILSLPGQSPGANYYEGKVLKIVVGSTPGGGYDRMARLFAKHLPKYIPGKPSVIVENMPGAAHIIGANYVYNIAKPDGLTIGAFQPGIAFGQLFKAEGVKFDIRKYSWIGSTAVEGTIFAIRNELPYKNFDDLRKEKNPLHVAGSGAGGKDSLYATLLKEIFGLNFKMINYPAQTEGMLAVSRKEVDGKAGSYSSLKLFIERGVLRPLIRGRVSEVGMENLPVDEELAPDKMGKAIFAMRSAGDQMGRPYVAPPGTPAPVLNILRDAFAKAANDRALREEAKKYLMEIEYVSAGECSKVLNHLFSQPENVIKEFSKYNSI